MSLELQFQREEKNVCMCVFACEVSLMGVPKPIILRGKKNSVRVKVDECHESYNLRGRGKEKCV